MTIDTGNIRPSLNHVALSVTNLGRSASWYENVFGITLQVEETAEGRAAIVLADPAWQLVISLVQHDANQGETFAETRTGLDHIGWWVTSRAELVVWQARLEANGVVRAVEANRPLTQSPIMDTSYGCFLTFRDPDNLQLHLSTPPQNS